MTNTRSGDSRNVRQTCAAITMETNSVSYTLNDFVEVIGGGQIGALQDSEENDDVTS